MNLLWDYLTHSQRNALTALLAGPAHLPAELDEQLRNLGVAERFGADMLALTPLGATVYPSSR